jgi:type II secretory pathway pseudopilin PulG
MYVATGEPSGKATASLICGIFFFVFPLPILAIIFGHLALSDIKKSGGRLLGHGRAVAGLVLGYMGVAAVPFILIIAAIAIPNLLRARIAANESSAVGSLRSINTAESTYRIAYSNVGYACTLGALGGSSANASSDAAGLINAQLASGTKSGYRFEIASCENGGDEAKYQVIATPVTPGQSGSRTFCSDQTGVIKSAREGEDCLESGAPLH